MGFWQRLFSRKPNRNIFEFWDGTRWRSADPIKALRILSAHPEFDAEKHPQLITAELPLGGTAEDAKLLARESSKACEITARAVREAFDLQPYEDGAGTTEPECVAILNEFSGWLAAQKKNTNPRPTSQPVTAQHSSRTRETTPQPLDSGSIVNGRKYDDPPLCSEPLAQP